jgi:hypothetical protein
MKASKKITMLFQSRYAIALVAVSSCVFGVTAKSFAKDTPPAPASAGVTSNSVNVTGSDTNTTPAAAAAVFSSDATGNITEGAVSAAVGANSAAATASHVNDGGTITNAAAALGSTGQIDVNQDLGNGTVELTNTTTFVTAQ